MIVHELQMLNKRAEAVPSGKGRGLDQQSGQLALLADVGVYLSGNFTEINSRKGAFGLHNHHANMLEKLELDHGTFPSSLPPGLGYHKRLLRRSKEHFYSITSSAVINNAGGNSSPSDLTAF